VRIEHDVLVTKDGYEILTARLPRTAEGIEAVMAAAKHTAPQ
jgi:Xaa-Pro aminopeptidase